MPVSVQAEDRDGWGDDAGDGGLLLSWAAKWDNPSGDTLFGEGGVTLAGSGGLIPPERIKTLRPGWNPPHWLGQGSTGVDGEGCAAPGGPVWIFLGSGCTPSKKQAAWWV